MAKGVQEAWSTTAADNGDADDNINFAEGQSPASVNNSARALMAAIRAWWAQISGGATYGGSSNAYTITSPSPGAITAYAAGMRFLWKPNATSSGSVTLNVDGVGAKKVYRPDGTTQLGSGDAVSGVPMDLVYETALDSSAGGFRVVGPFMFSDAQLTALAGISPVSGDVFYWTGADSLAALASTATGRTLLTTASASAARTTLGLVIGTDVQAYSARLAEIAALAVTDSNIIVGNGSSWVAESGATARTSLGAVAKAGDTMTGELILVDGTPSSPRCAGTVGIRQNAQSSNYILALSDIGKRVRLNGSSLTCTIPPESSVAWQMSSGFSAAIRVHNINASSATIVPGSGVTLLHRTLGSGTRTIAQHGTALLEQYTTDTWIITGDGLT